MSCGARPSPDVPEMLRKSLQCFQEWGVSRDGQRFLFAVPTAPVSPLQIVQNWQSWLPE